MTMTGTMTTDMKVKDGNRDKTGHVMATRKRTIRDVMMTMPLDTDDIDVVTSVDDDDEKDFSIQIQRHADMQMGTRPDIQACRGTQRNVRKSYKSTPPTSHFRPHSGSRFSSKLTKVFR